MTDAPRTRTTLAATGVAGLDDILGGGLTRDRLYLVAGPPGAGKTTLAMQFLLAGAADRESGLYVTMSETEDELDEMAVGHGWSLTDVDVCPLAAGEEVLHAEEQYTVFHPSDVELVETIGRLLTVIEQRNPARLVLDSLSELRLLAGNPLRYRRQVLALKQFFGGRRCTVLVLDDRLAPDPDAQLDSIAHGVIHLERLHSDYGSDRRRLRVSKLRSRTFRSGFHDYDIRRGGVVVFPRLLPVPPSDNAPRTDVDFSTGVPALDQLLGGGLGRGTSTLLTGPPGTGKSSLATQIACAVASRGGRAAVFVFDETVGTALVRGEGLGLDVQDHIREGRLALQQIDPAELSPGEFANVVRGASERPGTELIVIDSLNGFLNAMPNERHLFVHLHEILTFLGQRGISSILIGVQGGLIGTAMVTPGDSSFLADSVILLRYFEHQGAVRQAISVVKKRSGGHERTIREFRLDEGGVHVGAPLSDFHGVLTGVPSYVGGADTLMHPDEA